jgi:hypothetical protein
MRVLFASLVVLLVVAAGVDLALTRSAERRASEQATVQLGAPATVDLQGWPVTVRLLAGTLPAVEVRATDVPTDSGVRLATLDATLTRVRVRIADLAAGRLPEEAEDGTFVATLDREGVRQLLGDLGQAGDVQLTPGRVAFTVGGFTIESGVGVANGQLVLTPFTDLGLLPDTFQVPLPELPAGVDVQNVSVLDDALQLEGTFAPEALAELAASRQSPVSTVD